MSDLLQSKIKFWLDSGYGIRGADVYGFAKEHNITLTEAKEALQSTLPYLKTKHYNDKLSTRRNFMKTLSYCLGFIHMDLGRFPVDERTPKSVKGFLCFTDILSSRIWISILRNSKSASAFQNCVKRFLNEYKRDMNGHTPYSIACDLEPSMLSEKIKRFFKRRRMKLIFFRFSKNKAFFSENSILRLKTLYSQLEKNNPKMKCMYKSIEKLKEALNSRPKLIRGNYVIKCSQYD